MKNFYLSFSFLLLSTLALSENDSSHSGGAGTTAPMTSVSGVSTISLDAINRFKGQEIKEQDAFDTQTWNYIAPNEHYNYFFENCLPKEGGAYISVGTFRGMNVASSGRVSHLFLMDVDSSAVIFNRMNLQLVAKAKDRFQYLSYLFTGQENPELEKKVRDDEIKPAEFIGALLSKKPVSNSLLKDWKALGVNLPDGEWDRFEKNLSGGSNGTYGMSGLINQLKNEFNIYLRAENFDKTFMGNNDRFQKIKGLLKENKITVLAGNIAGDKSMKSLNELLRKDGLKVAGVDVSNVPDYLPDALDKKTIENIRTLPMREDARMFYTGGSTGTPLNGGDGWSYYAMHREHLDGLKSFPTGIATYETTIGGKHSMKLDPGNIPGTNGFYSSDDKPCN